MQTRFPLLSLLPGSRRLNEFNHPDRHGRGAASLFAVRDLANDLAAFNRVLIDMPPNLYFLSWCAMAAADFVLTPTFADPDGMVAIEEANKAVASIQASVNPALVHLGILLGSFQKRNAINIAYASGLRGQFAGLVFNEVIPHAAAFKEARKAETPISFYKPRLEATKAVGRVVDEIERRIADARTKSEAA